MNLTTRPLLPFLLFLLLSTAAQAALSVDEETGDGYLNGSDTSWSHYLEQMKRFPDRLGFICMNGYELNKTGDHHDGFMFMAECARRGNPPSMIYLSQMYADGHGVSPDAARAAEWLQRAAETGYAVAQYHYGVALLLGQGIPADPFAAAQWLERAALQGDSDAQAVIASGYDYGVAEERRPGVGR